MKIIIIGCGKVGLTLAELLSAEKHDVVLIDESSQKLSSIPEELDALRILGNGASVNIQQEAGVEEADLLIAVTGSDELNLLCCLIAKKAGNCHTIARVRNPIYNKEIGFIKEKLGISMIINPELTGFKADVLEKGGGILRGSDDGQEIVVPQDKITIRDRDQVAALYGAD